MAKKESLKERLKKRKGTLKTRGGGDFKFYTIPEGVTRMRPLPVGEENDWAFEATTFYLGKELGTVISPITFGGKCALMKKHLALKESKNEMDKDFAKNKLAPRNKWFVPHIKFTDEKGTEIDPGEAKLTMLATGQYNDLLDLYLDDEQGDFTDPINGYDIKYKRTGKGKMDTEYSLTPCKPTKLAKEFRKETYNPEEMLKALVPTYEETKEFLERFLNAAGSDEEETSEKPFKKKKKKSDM